MKKRINATKRIESVLSPTLNQDARFGFILFAQRSRTIYKASLRFSRASSKVAPWVWTPGNFLD